jgi:hypothetical protein
VASNNLLSSEPGFKHDGREGKNSKIEWEQFVRDCRISDIRILSVFLRSIIPYNKNFDNPPTVLEKLKISKYLKI